MADTVTQFFSLSRSLFSINMNRFLHEKREALDAIELLKLFAKHKGISVDISHDMKINDFSNPPSPSESEPITPIDKSNTDANAASVMDERNANGIEAITDDGSVSDTKDMTATANDDNVVVATTIDDTATIIKQPKKTNDNGNNYIKRNELIGVKKSATDI